MKRFLIVAFLLLSLPAIANNYADIAHKAYEEKDYQQAGELYERAYQQEKVQTYLDNAVTAYLSHAFNLSNDKEYDYAIKYCEKVLRLKPEDKNARELLSDIYFSRGSDYYFRGFGEKARNDLEKSLKYSILPEQKQRALRELADWKTNPY